MALASHESKEAQKKPSPKESVEGFIARKKAERGAEGMQKVLQSAEGVQHEVNEVLAGVEKPKEGISERGEKKAEPSGGGAASQGQATYDAGAAGDWSNVVFPDEEVMVKKIRTAVELHIQVEMKKAKRLESKLTSGGAQEYATIIARIRKLKNMLACLFTATIDYLKEIYMKYFSPDGRRKNPEEIQVD